MLNSVHTGRQLAQRATAWQAAAAVLVALAWLAASPMHALGALVGGLGITAGSWAAAKVALGGGVAPAGAAFARLMMGVAIKWVVVLLVLVASLAGFGLPGLAVITGVLGATLGMVLANVIRRKGVAS
ncbi:hypothetical protein [Pseudoxanthomonas sp.]|uniref:hypothetical protein n=1 Tax=Pseudoxanthomonas sp. TaxID=1871049 RepID=UPI00260F34D3|nr:hypothetical protein [Pseudoxanthomonas sp.]WDS34616.1 MAG: hypothetical protein O8I58_09395 [Pseudoxanthomonas sp.]